jgi:hypothetical protein
LYSHCSIHRNRIEFEAPHAEHRKDLRFILMKDITEEKEIRRVQRLEEENDRSIVMKW